MTRRIAPWVRPAAGLAALALLALLARGVLGEALHPQQALERLRAVEDQWWAWPVFLGAYFSLTLAFVPVTLFHMVSGVLLGFQGALALNLLAFNLSSHGQFLFARHVLRGRSARAAPGPAEARLSKLLERDGLRAAILVRVLPLPNLAVNLTAGLSPLRWRDFALGTLVGATPIVAVYTWFAAALVEGLAEARREAAVHALLAGGAIVLLALVSRRLGRRAPEAP